MRMRFAPRNFGGFFRCKVDRFTYKKCIAWPSLSYQFSFYLIKKKGEDISNKAIMSSSSSTRPSATTKSVPSSEGASGIVSVPQQLERFRLGYAASITQSPLHILSATRHKRVCVCDSGSDSFSLSIFHSI